MSDPESKAAPGMADVLAAHEFRSGAWGMCATCSCDEWESRERFYEGLHAAHRAHVATILAARIAEAQAAAAEKALRVARLVEADMSEVALKAWRSADARRGLSDHDALLNHADALTRWSQRFRMAFYGEDYRDDRARAARPDTGGAE